MVVQELGGLLGRPDHVGAGVLVGFDLQLNVLPLLLHLVQGLLYGVLLTGHLGHLGDGTHVILELHLQTLTECQIGLRSHWESNVIGQLKLKKVIIEQTNHPFHENLKDENPNYLQYLAFNNYKAIESWYTLEHRELCALTDLVPMSAPHSWVPQTLDEGNVGLEVLNQTLDLCGY